MANNRKPASTQWQLCIQCALNLTQSGMLSTFSPLLCLIVDGGIWGRWQYNPSMSVHILLSTTFICDLSMMHALQLPTRNIIFVANNCSYPLCNLPYIQHLTTQSLKLTMCSAEQRNGLSSCLELVLESYYDWENNSPWAITRVPSKKMRQTSREQ